MKNREIGTALGAIGERALTLTISAVKGTAMRSENKSDKLSIETHTCKI